MIPLVEIPVLVHHFAPHFASVFSADAFAQFHRYLSGLVVSENKMRAAQHDTALLHPLHQHVQITLDGSAGACRRNTQAQALWALAGLIQTGLTQGHTLKQVMQPILAAVSS